MELICLAIGEASVCWSEIPNGIFESNKAGDIARRLKKQILEIFTEL